MEVAAACILSKGDRAAKRIERKRVWVGQSVRLQLLLPSGWRVTLGRFLPALRAKRATFGSQTSRLDCSVRPNSRIKTQSFTSKF